MNRIDEYATLRAAFAAGARIQAWHLDESANSSAQGRWDTLPQDREPAFSCPAHLYRVHPEDARVDPEDARVDPEDARVDPAI